MNNPESPQNQDKHSGEGRLSWHKYAAIGAMVTTLAVSGGIWKHLDRSGEVDGYVPQNPVPEAIDNELGGGSWNMEHQTAERVGQIGKVINSANLDIMALQEVSGDDLDDLEQRFPGWHMVYAMGDAKARPLEGGLGNVLMARQRLKDVETISLNGTSLVSSFLGTAEGLVVDVAKADTSFENTKDGRQEDRVALAATIETEDEGAKQDVRVVVSHISGEPGIREEQSQELMDFIRREREANMPTIFLGDMNGKPHTVREEFKSADFETLHTGPTTIDGRTIDFGAEHDQDDSLKLARSVVLPNPKTDHYPVIFIWKVRASGE